MILNDTMVNGGMRGERAPIESFHPEPRGEESTTTPVKLLINYLQEAGVDCIFGVPGGPLMPFYEALHEVGGMKVILAKHEEGAAFMADGYARSTGKLGVCCVTAGPGATNAVTGIAVAYADSVPVLIITAQVSTAAFGRGALQESTDFKVDIIDLFKPITLASKMLIRPDKMGELVRYLFRVALTGRRGPVHINIPADLARKAIPAEKVSNLMPQPVMMNIDRDSVRKASQWLLRAKRPAILAGNGVNLSSAHAELRRLSERLQIPVATTVKAKGAFPEDHILSLGAFGFAGSPRADAYLLSGDVDVLLAVGTSLDEDSTAGWDIRLKPTEALLHIDIDPVEMGKNYAVAVPMVGDAKATLTELYYQLERDGKWLEPRKRSLEELKIFREQNPWCVDEEKMDSAQTPIKPQRLMKDLGAALPQDALIFTDIGNHMAWAFHYLRLNNPNSFHHCLGFASMGYGTSAVIGAKLGNPNRPVIALVGDACFAMNGMELHTAVENNLPIVWIVHNNGGHGMVYHGEKVQFGNRFHYSMFRIPIDFCQLARSLGAASIRVTKPGELTQAVHEALSRNGPVLIDAIVDPEEGPPVGSRIKALDKFFEPCAH